MSREPQSPDVAGLLAALERYRVRYVLIGSVAAQCYGVDVQPGDLDITPDPDRENLARLCTLLVDLEASLPETDEIGRWEVQADGEKKWVSRPVTASDRRQRAAWVPDPDDISTLDHLLHTRCGNLDVVPDLTGGYEALRERAVQMEAYGHQVWVVHVDELLAALTVPRRKKDSPRVHGLREIQRQRNKPWPTDSPT